MRDLKEAPAPVATPAEARGLPLVVAHRAGNSRKGVYRALEDGADYLEVDLWWHRGVYEARHEHSLHPLPFWWDHWFIRRAPPQPVTLPDFMRLVECRAGLFLDMKSGSAPSAARELTRALHSVEHPVPVKVSSQHWNILRWGRRHSNLIELFFSVDDPVKLTLLLSVAEDEAIEGCSVAHWLLDQAAVSALQERGLKVFAWTVDDPQRARQLVEFGVDGIITNAVAPVADALRHGD
jgi:glycerophosphoryl diester phosphodiesterase